MFKQTKETLGVIFYQIGKAWSVCSLCLQLFPILFLVYKIISQTGILYIDISLLIVLVAYFIFSFYIKNKTLAKKGKRLIRVIKSFIKFVNLVVIVYGLLFMTTDVTVYTVFNIIFDLLMILAWIIDVLGQIVSLIVETYWKDLSASFKKDVDKPANTVKTVFNKITGKEPAPLDKEQEKVERRLNKLSAMYHKIQAEKELAAANAQKAKEKEKDE